MTSASVSSSSPVASCMRGGYDYRLGDGMVGGGSGGMVGAGGRPGDASLAGSAAPQWWYPSGMGNPIQNVPTPPSVVCILPLRRVCGRGGGMFTFLLLPLRTLVFLVVTVCIVICLNQFFKIGNAIKFVCICEKWGLEGARGQNLHHMACHIESSEPHWLWRTCSPKYDVSSFHIYATKRGRRSITDRAANVVSTKECGSRENGTGFLVIYGSGPHVNIK